jgi:Ala-tRNA(Pro) deacylase
MSIAPTLDRFLERSQVSYEVTDHPHSATALGTARLAHLSRSQVAKGVVLKDKRSGRFLMAVLPAGRRLELKWLKDDYHLEPALASEWDLRSLFPDCEPGAVPPVGQAYHLTTIWDESLDRQREVFLEAGDHEHLLRLDHADFHRLFESHAHGVISRQE